MKYIQPYDKPSDPDASYVNGNPETGTPGSIADARAWEHPQRELVHLVDYAHAVRPADVDAPSEEDLQQVRKAVEALINNAIASLSIGGEFLLKADAYANLPIYPETVTNGGVISMSATVGQVTIATGQEFIWRGVRRFTTSSTGLSPQLVISTVANKTYHIVWYPPGSAKAPLPANPDGKIVREDLADVTYNPGAVTENNAQFNSDFDRILMARVVTSASNVPTITALKNKHRLEASETFAGAFSGTVGSLQHNFTTSLNWARTPAANIGTVVAPGGGHDSDLTAQVASADRYAVALYISTWPDDVTWRDSRPGVTMNYRA